MPATTKAPRKITKDNKRSTSEKSYDIRNFFGSDEASSTCSNEMKRQQKNTRDRDGQKGTPSKKPKLQLKGIFTNDDHLYRNPQDIAGLPETLSDLDDEENSNLSASSTANNTLECIVNEALDSEFKGLIEMTTLSINFSPVKLKNTFSLRKVGVIKDDSELHFLKGQSLNELELIFLIHHSNPLRFRIIQNLPLTDIQYKRVRTLLHFAFQCKYPLDSIDSPLYDTLTTMNYECSELLIRNEKYLETDRELKEFGLINMESFLNIVPMIDLSKWLPEEIASLLFLLSLLYLDEGTRFLGYMIVETIIFLLERDRREKNFEMFSKLVGQNFPDVILLNKFISPLMTSNFLAQKCWEIVYYFFAKFTADHGEQNITGASIHGLFSKLPTVSRIYEDKPTDFYYLFQLVGTCITDEILNEQKDIDEILSLVKKSKEGMRVNLKIDHNLTESNSNIQHRLEMLTRRRNTAKVNYIGGRSKFRPNIADIVSSSDED